MVTSYSEMPLDLDVPELSADEDGLITRRSILPGGVRVLTRRMPHQHSTSIGLWVGTGSRDEGPGTEGSTHFLEHLLFKGTAKRSAKEIAERIDYLGGGFNAATGKQSTCYYGHVFDEDLPDSLELLADMVTSARLDAEDMEMERGVILEELAMYNDDSSDVAHQAIPQMVYDDHPLGRPVGGTRESVSALKPESLQAHYKANYHANELVVTAAGAVDHDWLCDTVLAHLDEAGWDTTPGVRPHERRNAGPITFTAGGERKLERNVEQAAVIVGMPGIGLFDERRHALFALSAILGGGTSSRMFQSIREERGLAYSTYSFPASYPEGGLFGLYAGCAPSNASQVADLMVASLEEIAVNGVSDDEVESAFRRIRADIVFDDERISSHMNTLGTAELVRGALISQKEQLRRSRAVTASHITELAREIISGPRSMCTVGPAA
ncbi:insulinase family protein [Arcanobacterium haemolyticum]|nr:insulinase family protein [Arcanobacterium haemolyticum]